MSGPKRIYTIAPHARFARTLATALLDGRLLPDWPREGPFWLADVTLYLPTQRSREAVAQALIGAMGADPLLLPDLRALGGEDPLAEPFVPPYDAVALPPPLGRMRRLMLLAQLTERWLAAQQGTPFSAPGAGGHTGAPHAGEVLALARSLGTLIDDFLVARRDGFTLAAIEDAQLAAQQQESLSFVTFVLENWPAVLEAEGAIEAAERTNLMLDRQAEALAAIHGDKPVIVAGSTGSMPATAGLMAAVARLARGAIVVPGLDTQLDGQAHQALLEERNAPHGHPQYGLARLMRRLGTPPATVIELARGEDTRTRVLNGALALAEDTARWRAVRAEIGPEAMGAAVAQMSILGARTPDLEARAIALAVRARLAAGGDAAVIAPDQTLARRIAAELDRFGIETDDAAGTPLARSEAGRLVRQIVTLVTGGYGAVDLVALLRNRHVRLGLGRSAVASATLALDLGVLRGQRPAPGLEGLRGGLKANLDRTTSRPARRLDAGEAEVVSVLLARLEDALAPLSRLLEGGRFTVSALAEALGATLGAVRAAPGTERVGTMEGQAEMSRWFETCTGLGARGPLLDAFTLPQALEGLLANESVRPRRPSGARAAIYGRLEARLISADLTILAGLVEGAWPEAADPGPWLSRGMRMAAGLEPPERQHGLAAHDFLMAAGQGEVILSYAERAGTGPAVPSRLLQRLEAFLGSEVTAPMRARGRRWVEAAAGLDAADGPTRPATRPAPRPPAHMRPRRLSVTEAETLLRSPYDLYARHVLRLSPIPALGADPDAAERGTIIHAIFGDFIIGGGDPLAPDAHQELMEIAAGKFAGLEAIPERRDIWLRRFEHAARGFLAFEHGRAETVLARHAERRGEASFTLGAGEITLSGRADRIDTLTGGTIEIIDFKTGGLPAPGDMKGFFAPQMPLEARMAAAGGFGPELAAPATALTYVKIANGPQAFTPTPYRAADGMALGEAVDETFRRFSAHAAALLLSDEHPMAAQVFPRPGQRFKGDYEHLARTAEWAVADPEDDPS
ncbi:double-strand break repair protein AddB [Pelagibacterium montanilacus]|uniref:double-strand break repair protein AddB n=1 Tax=Pelagibacterium montanilacus TaxID=2185280 RepID=UPI000F8DCFB1|nr:double-strand break repair protein AddB [Pelagibacterium montanilacus]